MDEFLKLRNDLLRCDMSNRTGGVAQVPTDPEKKAAEYFDRIRDLEIKRLKAGRKYTPLLHFFRAKKIIDEESTLYKIVRKMPKGSLLHVHSDGIVSLGWVLQKCIEEHGDCYVSEPVGDVRAALRFFKDKGMAEAAGTAAGIRWRNAREWRASFPGGPAAFDNWFFRQATLFCDNPDNEFKDRGEVWKRFEQCFQSLDQGYTFLPFFKKYHYESFRRLFLDGLLHVELRVVGLYEFYDHDGKKPFDAAIEALVETLSEFNSNQRAAGLLEMSAKVIYCGVRSVLKEKMADELAEALRLRQKYPDVVVGFDIVGDEERGKPLLYYAKELVRSRQEQTRIGVSVPFFFHAGETVSTDSPTTANLFDAVVLDSKRLGHGFAIPKHIAVLGEEIRRRMVAVEVCPISNQILHLVSCLVNHPIITMMHTGIPVTLNCDDPAPFAYERNEPSGLSSYDFYQIIMSFPSISLPELRRLAVTSLEHSALRAGSDEAARVWARWKSQWDQFVTWLVEEGPQLIKEEEAKAE